MKKIIIINGPATSGKGTFIKTTRLFMQQHSIPVYSFSSIFPSKMRLIQEGLWDGKSEKTKEARDLMIAYKKQSILEGDQPTKYLIQKIKETSEEGLIFVHIREAEEIEKFIKVTKEELGILPLTMHLDRTTKDKYDTSAENGTREYKNYTYDIHVDVYGLDYLSGSIVKPFLEHLYPDLAFELVETNNIATVELHREFEDELGAGII